MAYPTFLPLSHPDEGIDRSRTPAVRVNEFNDGYSQISITGINSNFEDIQPKWTNAYKAEGEYIINFLEGRKGLPFLWQVNGQGPVKCYRCVDYTTQQMKGNYYNITVKLKQMALI